MHRFFVVLFLSTLFCFVSQAQTLDLPSDTVLCYNEEDPASYEVDDDWDECVWTDSLGNIVGTEATLEITQPGEYFLVATDTMTGSSESGSMEVEFNVVPVPQWNSDTTICPEETIELTVRNPSDYDVIGWSFPAITTEPPVEGAVFVFKQIVFPYSTTVPIPDNNDDDHYTTQFCLPIIQKLKSTWMWPI